MQNIGASNSEDAFYRYKMPKLMAKVEGRGNGIKTNIVNNVDIAKALARAPEYTLKFFGCELGAQTNFDIKTGMSILNGAHDSKKLQELLEGFIKRYVQCHSCGNPETVIKIRKEFIHLKCKACGHVSDVDMRHKLCTFILKNPPENKLSKEERRLKKVEEERFKGVDKGAEKVSSKDKTDKKKSDKKDKKKKGEDGEGGEEGIEAEPSTLSTVDNGSESESEEADDGVVWMTDTSEAAVQKRAEEQLTLATASMVTQGNIEAERIEAERKVAEAAAAQEAAERKVAEEAAAAKAEEDASLAQAAARLALEEEAAAQVAARLGDANVQALRSAIAGGADASALAAQLKAMTLEGGLAGRMRVLQQAVFGEPANAEEKLAAVVRTHKALFALHSKDAAGQLAQLVALEHYLAVAAPERVKETALVVKAMYDLDLLDEEVIVGWASKLDVGQLLGVPADGARAVRKAAAPLVEWLQKEESEEDDDE